MSYYERQGLRFLDKILTIDKTWFHHFEPSQWCGSHQLHLCWKRPDFPSLRRNTCLYSSWTGRNASLAHGTPWAEGQQRVLSKGCSNFSKVHNFSQPYYYVFYIWNTFKSSFHLKRDKCVLMSISFDLIFWTVFERKDWAWRSGISPSTKTMHPTINFLGFKHLEHALYSPDSAHMDFSVLPNVEWGGERQAPRDTKGAQLQVQSIISLSEDRWYEMGRMTQKMFWAERGLPYTVWRYIMQTL